MTVDEYKAKYGERSLSESWEIKNVVHTYKIPVALHTLLDETMKKLNRIYIPNAWSWVRLRQKDTWREILEIEESINVAVEGENEEYLREALRMYYEVWVRVIEKFKPMKDEYVPF